MIIVIGAGIVGGFAPPTPSAIHIFDAAPNQLHLNISSVIRPDGSPELQSSGSKYLSTSESDTNPLVDELHGILKEIPTEQPPGSEDIYGLDTSIAWQSDDGFEWYNGGPQGCGGGESFVKPTADQKAKFKRAVEIVNALVNRAK